MKIKTTSVRRLDGRKIPTWLINKVATRAAPWLRALVDRRREAAILKAHRVHGIPLDAVRLYTGIAESDRFTAEDAHKAFGHLAAPACTLNPAVHASAAHVPSESESIAFGD
jgi:hypothetical protein